MSRYIDADKLIHHLYDEYHGMISDESMKIYKIIRMLDNAPTADVREIFHAHYDENGDCSNCGCAMPTDDKQDFIMEKKVRYCYCCGAKMDKE